MNLKLEKLKTLGAGEFKHLNGSLIEHLERTHQLLVEWRASQALCDAGLYHAAYGTIGFDTQVITLFQRQDIAKIIGQAAEDIVYLYCSCDRPFVFKAFDTSKTIKFKDRFTKKEFNLTHKQAQQFCELTVANELELAIESHEFLIEHGKDLYHLFIKMKPLLSQPANDKVANVLGAFFNNSLKN